ncbi:MAG: YraN family protein, partial [Lawsonibacter sp.]|nr:YraN family protein [Lawsonibacter sp.]
VEVKLRKSAAYGSAGDFVDRRKQSRLRAAAELYLAKHLTDLQPRFDVIEIYAPQGTNTVNPRIFHLENAF